MMQKLLDFYRGKRVLLTGHTGFKGTWMSVALVKAGATVLGYSSCSKTEPRLFDLSGVSEQMIHVKGDVRDAAHLRGVFDSFRPEIVIHMAAQPIVREGYRNPLETYEVNVMGTVNVLDCVRVNPCVRSFLNVTTDKVYENKEWEWGYRENDALDGFDPYSNSKSCSELVTHCYKNSFFNDGRTAISTARAGNVIGGGDFAKERIIPDCVRAAIRGETIIVHNPSSTRPYQHVLEPVFAYLLIAAAQYEDESLAAWYNIGPDDKDCFQTGALVDCFVKEWGEGLSWKEQPDGGPHEANYLKLDSSKIKAALGWYPRWDLSEAIDKVVEWTKCWISGEDVRACMERQIEQYLNVEKANGKVVE